MSARRGWLAQVVSLLALLALAQPAASAVRPGWEERPRSLHLAFRAPASNGYEMSVDTSGHRQVTLTLAKGGVSATYRTTGRVSRNGIEADFGELGEVSVEFSGRPTRFKGFFGLPPWLLPHPKCSGRRPQQESGGFHGTIRFEGENGFARIDADQAKGTVRRTYRRLCKGDPSSLFFATLLGRASASAVGRRKIDKLHMDALLVDGRQAGRRVAFSAIGFSGSSGDPLLDELIKSLGPFAVARTFERREGMRINRLAFVQGGEGSLIVSPPKRKRVTATVAFPRPLEGTAKLEHAPGTPPTWIGTLLARLPGAGAVPLTGEGLRPVYCRVPLDLGEGDEDPCMKKAGEAVPGAGLNRPLLRQESGSHSQALADVKLSWSR